MIGYWLLPAEPARTWFVSTIEQLARKYNAPLFAPHVTLYSEDADEGGVRDKLEDVAAGHQPLELAISGIEHSGKLTKTLFVQFGEGGEARQLSNALRTPSKPQNDYDFNPHLSLIYAHLTLEARLAGAHGIEVPFERVRFDAITAINFPRSIKSRADVEAWRMIAPAKLGGSSAPRSI